MPTQLEKALEAIARQFANSVISAVLAANAGEVASFSRASTPSTARRSSTRSPRRWQARGRDDAKREAMQAALGRVLAILRSRGPMRSEQLQKQLAMTKEALVGPLRFGIETKQISKSGQRRATTYRVA